MAGRQIQCAPSDDIPGGAIVLHPAASMAHPVAFYQGIPFKQGDLRLAKPMVSLKDEAGTVSAIGSAATYWPDGSVQWMRVEGTARGGVKAGQPLALHGSGGAGESKGATEFSLKGRIKASPDGTIRWSDAASGKSYALIPEASLVKISKAKPEPPTDPDWLDREGQYAWAMPLESLADAAKPIPLKLRLRQQKVEEENRVYSVVCFQGDGGEAAPGAGLEWQLRVKLYHDLALIRTEMTWIAQWDVTQYALASAKWSVQSDKAWSGFALPGGEAAPHLRVENDHRGAGVVNGKPSDAPSVERDGLVALSPDGPNLAIGIYNFSRLGPNHLLGEGNRVEIASWSDHSGRALDLRRSTSRNDYGTSDVDFKWNGRGVSRTLYATLALSNEAGEARAQAHHEAARDYLWFANAADLHATQVLGPCSEAAITQNPEIVRGMQANLHFLRSSRDYWRWSGWANFGDIRTNFAKGDNPERGLHAGRWVLNGRYGWRNASGIISTGFIQMGILLDDRALILAGVDNAEHIIDVDAFHGSLFSADTGDRGGLRRRNRDHWSGAVEAQYSPCYGLYLTQWLTGGRRSLDTLQGLRGYASRNDPGNSVYPAAAWLFHYQETHAPAALSEANRLLDRSAAWWKEYTKTPLHGLAALYAGNFRRVSDGIGTLIAFHQATHDPRYLEAMEVSAGTHPFAPKSNISVTARLYELAYLHSQGVASLPDDARAREHLAEYIPTGLPSSEAIRQADYATLCELITTQLPPAGNPTYRESNAIAGRAVELPCLLEQYGQQAAPVQPSQSHDRHH